VSPPGRGADLPGGGAGDTKHVRSVINHGDTGSGQHLAEPLGFRAADEDAGGGVVNEGDIDACVALLSPDFVMNMAGLPTRHGPDVWRQGVQVIKRGFPDLRAHIDGVVAAGDQVALRLTFRGTHQGEFLGMPATGRTIEYVSHEFYRIAGGLFAEEWICSDTATLYAQLTSGDT
jgi:steroid delta-isomerase-like uncharacterized protein